MRAWNLSCRGLPEGETGLLVTRTVDTGPGGENDPNRMLAKIVAYAGCSRAALEVAEFAAAASSAEPAVAGRCGSGARAASVFLREAGRSQ